MYVPLHVGAALSQSSFGIERDDTGDNISQRNPYFSELTALYWLWKNSTADYKGLVHYRRYFASPGFSRHFKTDRMSRIISKDELLPLLHAHSIVVPRKRNYVIETVYSHYSHTLHASQLNEARKVLGELYPDCVQSFDKVMKRRKAHIFNMMVMRADLFGDYCTFLFTVLDELCTRMDPRQYDSFNARYPGRVSELLLDVWIDAHHYGYSEVPLVNIEPVNWVKKGGSFLLAKFFGKKYQKSF
jgi:hypothetical protein